MTEIWRNFPIKELSNDYEISNFGRGRKKDWTVIWTRNRIHNYKGYILRQYDRRGYKMFDITKNHKRFNLYVHRMVALAFIDNPLNKEEVNHIDANKNNNCVDNLEWVTKKENMNHAKKNNLIHALKGYMNNRSKEVLLYDAKLEIYKKFGSMGECARFLHCNVRNVQKCCHRYETTGTPLYNRYYIKFVK